MMNLAQLASTYRGVAQAPNATDQQATALVIELVFGQVQAFISDSASLQQTADQVVNTVNYLDDSRTDVNIDTDTLYAWAWRYVHNTTVLPNGIKITEDPR